MLQALSSRFDFRGQRWEPSIASPSALLHVSALRLTHYGYRTEVSIEMAQMHNALAVTVHTSQSHTSERGDGSKHGTRNLVVCKILQNFETCGRSNWRAHGRAVFVRTAFIHPPPDCPLAPRARSRLGVRTRGLLATATPLAYRYAWVLVNCNILSTAGRGRSPCARVFVCSCLFGIELVSISSARGLQLYLCMFA